MRLSIITALLILTLSSCGIVVNSEPEAEIQILRWSQSTDLVTLYVKVWNTGPTDIDLYRLIVLIEFEDGSAVLESVEGSGIARDGTEEETFTITTGSEKKVVSVEIDHYEWSVDRHWFTSNYN